MCACMHATYCVILVYIVLFIKLLDCRDPRWGRGQETPGEGKENFTTSQFNVENPTDPYVISQYVINFAHGMQEDNANELVVNCIKQDTNYIIDLFYSFLKTVVTCKHFAAYGKICFFKYI